MCAGRGILFRYVTLREAKRLPYGADERFCGFADRRFLVGAWYRRDVEGAVPYRWVDGTGNESGDPQRCWTSNQLAGSNYQRALPAAR